jgi:2',3'-cyclic-nucleotide 2'-phosphodiesterase (5'-nucleotidase family)
MKKILVIVPLLLLLIIAKVSAESVTIVYQNDLHGWLFPSSTQVGIDKMAGILAPLFEKEPSSFYTLSGDLFTGPNLSNEMKGISELMIWNEFWKELSKKGYGERILISAGNHEFDYGVPEPRSFESGLLCTNLVKGRRHSPYYTPYKILKTEEGLKLDSWASFLKKMGYGKKLRKRKI